MKTIRVMIADDHVLFRQGVATVIKQEADMETGGDDKLLAVLVDQVCGLYRNTKITMRPA